MRSVPMNFSTVEQAIRHAWRDVPAAAPADVELFATEWGDEAAEAFEGVKPVDVDLTSPGFLVATPLLDLPPGAAAAYLAPFMLSLLRGLEAQDATGVHYDFMTRTHLLASMTWRPFWQDVVGRLGPAQLGAYLDFCEFVLFRRADLHLDDEEVSMIESGVRTYRDRSRM